MDTKNTPIQHTIVGIFSLVLVLIFRFFLDTPWATTFGRASFILLFLILMIGPVMRLKKPLKTSDPLKIPWTWRGELGIWFAITALIHFILLLTERSFSSMISIGGSGYALANLMGLIALVWAIILLIASFGKVISFLGLESWKWLHSFTYVIFYLVSAHFIYFQFFSTYGNGGPDWFGYTAVSLAVLVVVFQLSAFVKAIIKNKKKLIK